MIDIISGQVASFATNYVVIMVGGIGFRVHTPTTVHDLIEGTGQHVTLYTHLAVREDALTLYGFTDADERSLFETLLGVSGIGPRLALAILSTLTIEHLKNAIAREEPEVLTRVPGIGKKSAQKIVFELKDKLQVDAVTGLAAISDTDADVIAALTALGYSVVEVQTALQAIPRDAPKTIEDRVRLALDYFA